MGAADCCVLLPQAVHQGLLRSAWLARQAGSAVLPQTTSLDALRELVLLGAGVEVDDIEQQLLDGAERLRQERRFGAALSSPQRLPARLQLSRELLQLRAALIRHADAPQPLRERLRAQDHEIDEARWLLDGAASGIEHDQAWQQRSLMVDALQRQARALVLVDDGSSDPAPLLRRLAGRGMPVLWLQARCSHGLGSALLAAATGRRPPNAARAARLLQRRCTRLAPDTLETQARAVLAAVLEQRAADPQSRIAVVAVDRRLSRRVNALLTRLRLPVLDEAGWLLSTTSAAAALDLLFELAAPDPGCDLLLDWMKQPGVAAAAGIDDEALAGVERALRQQGLHDLAAWQAWDGAAAGAHALALRHVRHCRQPWRAAPGTASAWTGALLEVARRSGLSAAWESDAAGRQLLQWLALREQTRSSLHMGLEAYRAWIEQGLERALYRPPATGEAGAGEAVRLLALDDAVLRPWDLCVIAGADAGNFPPPPQSAAGLSDALAVQLGLPDRVALRQRQLQRIAALVQGSRRLLLVESAPRPDHPGPSPLLQL